MRLPRLDSRWFVFELLDALQGPRLEGCRIATDRGFARPLNLRHSAIERGDQFAQLADGCGARHRHR
jgi:hypothetical protein